MKPKVIVVHGVYRSGSTWLFNAIQEVIRLTGREHAGKYSDQVDNEIETAIQTKPFFVLKCHHPSQNLLRMANEQQAIFFVTCRDPRDSISSMMNQFNTSFELAKHQIKQSCDAAILINLNNSPSILKYEESFVSKLDTIRAISDRLCITLTSNDCKKIFDSLHPQRIKALIQSYLIDDVFDGSGPLEQDHPVTHWHPNHIGDGLVGKYRRCLTRDQIAVSVRENYRFLVDFGYV
jgi:hypothetical protein